MSNEIDDIKHTVLVTGATGVLGSRIVCELLKTTETTIYCLSRAKSADVALAEIKKLVFVYDQPHQLEGEMSRLVPVLGDITKPEFGLDEKSYQALVTSVSTVFHCAANVSLIASFNKLKPVNVDGTQRVVDLCLASEAVLLYVSSFSVIGDQLFHDVTLMEDELDIGQQFEDLDYERTKFESEKLIHEAGEAHGLRWAIARPGNIWGDSETGAYPLFETKVKGIYYEMIKSLVETGYTFTSNEDFDVSPVDYVAKGCLHIAFNIHKTGGKTYHLTSPHQNTYDDIVTQLRHYDYKVRVLDNDEYFEALYEERLLLNGKPYRSIFTDLMGIMAGEELEELAKYDTKQAQQLLEPEGIYCAKPDYNLMKVYLDYATSRQWIPMPDAQGPLAEISEEMKNKIYMQHLYDEDFAVADATV